MCPLGQWAGDAGDGPVVEPWEGPQVLAGREELGLVLLAAPKVASGSSTATLWAAMNARIPAIMVRLSSGPECTPNSSVNDDVELLEF